MARMPRQRNTLPSCVCHKDIVRIASALIYLKERVRIKRRYCALPVCCRLIGAIIRMRTASQRKAVKYSRSCHVACPRKGESN